MQTADRATRLFHACDPTLPLEPGDARYVDCDQARGENLVRIYERALRRAKPEQPEVKLFTGHRGVGKSSELLRLKKDLESERSGEGCFAVVYFDVSDRLDLNDLDFPDLLILTAAEVQAQLRAMGVAEFAKSAEWLRRVYEDIVAACGSKVALAAATVQVPFGDLAVELRNRPNSRQELRAAIEARQTSLLDALNDLLIKASEALRGMGKRGLVLIVDGLEKITYRHIDGGATNTHDRLFIDRGEQLASLKAHVVYTVPISLLYSPRCAILEQTLGEVMSPVPMIKLRPCRSQPAPEGRDSPGMQALWQVLQARCRFAEVEFRDTFDSEETAQWLCRMSGGHIRHLMVFVQSALNELDNLPITRSAAERAVRKYANSLLREIPDEYWPKLRAFREPQDNVPKDEDHQLMLFLLHVFEYMNGEPWYEANPVLHTLARFEAGA